MYFAYYACTIKLRFKCTSRTTLVLQSCDFSAGAAEVYFAYSRSSWSCGGVLRMLHVYYKVAIAAEVYFAHYACSTKLRFKFTSRTKLVLQSYNVPAGAAEMYFAYCTCTKKLRFFSWSCRSVLRVLHQYYKIAIFHLDLRKCTSRTARVLQSCDFPAWLRKCTLRTTRVLQSCDFSWSCGSVLHVHSRTTLVLKSCDCELELRKCISFATLVLQSCDLSVLRVLHLHYKVAIFQLELLHMPTWS